MFPLSAMLAVAMTIMAIINAALMAWLWRFPMIAEPGNPHGRSSAPRSWTLVHRGIGWLFVLCYATLLVLMLPRLWQFREWSAVSVLHAAGGLLIGALLVVKISVIRFAPRLSAWLPWLGGGLLVLTLAVSALGMVPLGMVLKPAPNLSADATAGRELLPQRCLQCHGASVIAEENERPEKWHRELREMQKRAARSTWATPISDAERLQIAEFLIATRGREEHHGRGRGRGGRD